MDPRVLNYAWRQPDDLVEVSLPDPSPRKLCCSCGDWYPYAKASDDPSVHLCGAGIPDIVCPVAPVPGVHGGMRLWPAPFKGHAWAASGPDAWKCGIPGGFTVYARDIRELWEGLAPWCRDVGLGSFYLPPAALLEPDRYIPGPLADDAELEMVAARVGRGEVKAVRR